MIFHYIPGAVFQIASLGCPVLIISAFLIWHQRHRSDLPVWRGQLGLASMVIISFYWITFVLVFITAQFIRFNHLANQILDVWFDCNFPAMLVAAALAVALRGKPRTLTIAASVLVVAMFLAGAHY